VVYRRSIVYAHVIMIRCISMMMFYAYYHVWKDVCTLFVSSQFDIVTSSILGLKTLYWFCCGR
jgi:hypothetical protein